MEYYIFFVLLGLTSLILYASSKAYEMLDVDQAKMVGIVSTIISCILIVAVLFQAIIIMKLNQI